MNVCVQGEVKIVLFSLSKGNLISFVPGKDLIPGRSAELARDKGRLQNGGSESCTLLGIPRVPEAWVELISHFVTREFRVKNGDETLASETMRSLAVSGRGGVEQQTSIHINHAPLELFLCLALYVFCCSVLMDWMNPTT